MITFRDETLGRVLVLEATGRGFWPIPWSRWRQANMLVARFALKIPPEDQLEALHRLTEKLGAEYDTVSLLGFLFRRWRKRYRNPLSSATRLICSEAVALYLSYLKLVPVNEVESYEPHDLYMVLHKSLAAEQLL